MATTTFPAAHALCLPPQLIFVSLDSMRALISWVAAAALVVSVAAGHAATAPNDFAIRARFFPGAGNDGGPRLWRLAIDTNGTATYETYSYSPHRTHLKKRQLSSRQLLGIYTAIQRAAFFQLPRRIYTPHRGSEPGHQMGIRLQVTAAGRAHEVLLDVPGTLRDRRAAKRFWSVWRAISLTVPSPNRNDEFTYWFQNNPL